MKQLFLVKGKVNRKPYMQDASTFSDIRLVRASSLEEAEEIFSQWWEAKTIEYSCYYYATGEAMETLGDAGD